MDLWSIYVIFFGEVNWGRDDWVELIYEVVEENFSIWDSTLVQSTNNLITNILKLIGVQLEEKKTLQLKYFHSEKLFETKLLSFPCFRRIASGTIDVVKLPNSSPNAPIQSDRRSERFFFNFPHARQLLGFCRKQTCLALHAILHEYFRSFSGGQTQTHTHTQTSSTIFNRTHNRINVTWKSKDTSVVYLCVRTPLLTNWRRIWRKEARVFHPFLSESKLENAFCTWEIFLYFHPPTTQCQQRSASVNKDHLSLGDHISPKQVSLSVDVDLDRHKGENTCEMSCDVL